MSLCGATEYYVRPTEPTNTSCPGQPCLTINQYTNDSDHYFKSNTVFKFLLGTHELYQPVYIKNVSNVLLESYIINDTNRYPLLAGWFSGSLAHCTDGTGHCTALTFYNVHNVTIRGIGVDVMLQKCLRCCCTTKLYCVYSNNNRMHPAKNVWSSDKAGKSGEHLFNNCNWLLRWDYTSKYKLRQNI